MSFFKTTLLYTSCVLVVSGALAAAPQDEITPVKPAVIEQLEPTEESQKSIPEPGTFGAICIGIATVIYARRWRSRT